jgi:maltose-binding protein MalE
VASTALTSTKAPIIITIWTSLTGVEHDALAQVINQFQLNNPGIVINETVLPFNELENKFITEVSNGGGPNLLYGPQEWISILVQADLITPLDNISSQIGLSNLNPIAVAANSYHGKVYAFPESLEINALWYNKDMVASSPLNSDELLKDAALYGLAMNTSYFQVAGFINAEGGHLFDGNLKCILDQGSDASDALTWLVKASQSKGVVMNEYNSELDNDFKTGKVGMIFESSNAKADFESALGPNQLAVAAPVVLLPGGNPYKPILRTMNFYMSTNAKSVYRVPVIKFLNFLSQPGTQVIFANIGHIPTNPKTAANPIIKGLITQSLNASFFPNEFQMAAVWTPTNEMIQKVLFQSVAPTDAISTATLAINQANKK